VPIRAVEKPDIIFSNCRNCFVALSMLGEEIGAITLLEDNPEDVLFSFLSTMLYPVKENRK
jgi:hypothetical protein